MRIVFMGTPGFAVPALQRLIDSGQHDVAAVVTQPDRPTGRGRKIAFPPVKELALDHRLPVLQPERLRKQKFDQALAIYKPDVIVVVAYGQILPQEILDLPKYGCLNIHASLLPKYRGAAPMQWALINGETQTGVTIMHMDKGLDTGAVIAFEQTDILPDDDLHSMSNLLSVMGGELLIKVLDKIEAAGKIASIPQDHDKATYASLLEKKDGLLDWSLDTETLICRIKGLQPWPGAFSFLHGKAWRILEAKPYENEGGTIAHVEDYEPGMVTAIARGKGFAIKTGDGNLLVTKLQPADKKAMSAPDAINGKHIKTRDQFISDPNFLAGTSEDRVE